MGRFVRGDDYAISLTESDFATGSLHQASNIRPNRLFTADTGIILYRAASISPSKMKDVQQKLMHILAG